METMTVLRLRLLGIACLLGLSGCTANVRMVLNPDNSGKMIVSVKTVPLGGQSASVSEIMASFKKSKVPPQVVEEYCATVVRSLTRQCQGFSAWSDAEYREEDHVSYITLTGYFPDATKASIGYTSSTPGAGLVRSSTIGKDGKWLITIAEPKPTPAPGSSPRPTIDADVAAQEAEQSIELARQAQDMLNEGLQKADAIVALLPDNAGHGEEIEVAGTILKAVGDFKTDGKSVAGKFESVKDIWSIMKKLAADEKTAAALIRIVMQNSGNQSVDLTKVDPQTLTRLREFAAKNWPTDLSVPDRLTVEPGKPIFDYKKEVAQALKNPGRLLMLPEEEKPETDEPVTVPPVVVPSASPETTPMPSSTPPAPAATPSQIPR